MTRDDHRHRDIDRADRVIVGQSTLEDALAKAGLKAENCAAKQLDVDAKDVDKAVQETAKDVS